MRFAALPFIVVCLLVPVSLLAADGKPTGTGRMVSIEIAIAQLAEGKNDVELNLDSGDKLAARIAELEKQGHIAQMTRMRLATLDQQPAQLQFGQRTPVASGRTRTGGFNRGGAGNPPGAGGPMVATTYTIENVGTMIGVTPRVESDGAVTLEMSLEKSQLEPSASVEAGAEASDVPPNRTSTMQSKSTVRVRSGQTAVVGQSQVSTKGATAQCVILVTARVSDAAASTTADAANEKELKVFALRHLQAESSAAVLTRLFKDAGAQIEVDNRTNSVLVRGSGAMMADIQAILTQLDRGEGQREQ